MTKAGSRIGNVNLWLSEGLFFISNPCCLLTIMEWQSGTYKKEHERNARQELIIKYNIL